MKNKGKIIPNGVILKTHEIATVVLFTEQGFDVELIPKSNIKGIHTPDVQIDGVRRTKRHQTKCLHELEKEFQKSKSIHRLKIIKKDGKSIDFAK